MSDEKKKVKDLALELGLSNKELLSAARELGITAAKVAASSLTEADAGRLRRHFAPPGEDKPEVRVRRKSRTPQPQAAESAAPGVQEQADLAPLPQAVDPDTPAAAAELSPAPAQAAASDAPTVDQAHEAAPPVADGAPESLDAAPEKPRAAAAPATPKAGREGKKPAATPPAARVIMRPEEAAALEAERKQAEERAAREEAEREARQQAEEAARKAEEAQAAREQQPAAEPEAQTGATAAEAGAKSEEEDEGQAPAKEASPQKTFARVVRPAAFSAEPERGADGQAVSSAPQLAPRPDHASDDTRDAGMRQAFDDDEASSSQVRIISRPDPRQAPAGRTPRPGGPGRRPGAPAGDSRSGTGDRGAAGRPAPGRTAAPGGRGGAAAPGARSGAPGSYSPRPAPGGAPGNFAPASPDSEQGRKKRQKGRRTVDFTDTRTRGGDDDAGWSKSASRRGKSRRQRATAPMGGTQPQKAVKRKIKVDEFIRVSDLAHQMGLKSGEIIKVLFTLGVMATINQSLDIDTATLVAGEFGYEIEKVGFSEQDLLDAQQEQIEENPEDFASRPPVVTIMGHVDHGKTSLLDAIRKSSVVTGEAGGITQHIGAYHVKTKRGEIVFLDTPGHEAFTAMRARGAEITDIVVLVVAADDGVMEQTKEAISHSKAAGVPIMVAVNKMDKEAANPDRVKRELAEQGLVAEDWGGDTTFSYVSAKTRAGLDELLELLALQAEILELRANPKRTAVGHIVEAKLDKGRGALGTVLIQQGTLHVGDAFVCGIHSGKVRAMFNDQGKKAKEAGPSMPVEVQGFEGVPEAGEEFIVLADEKAARRIAESRTLKQRERELAKESKITLETFLARKADSVEAEVLNLVVKADVQGSLEAITDALRKMSTEKVRIEVIHGGTGAISESDVLLATASDAIIIGFNVRPTTKAKELAEHEKVDIRFYDIIYKLVEEIKSAMEGMLAPVSREEFLGLVEVRETFSVPKVGVIAGCHVSEGKILRNAQIRLLRDGVVVHTGRIGSLRRFKDDVREVAKGYECGIGIENFNDVKVGDVIEAFEIVEEAATL
ncbi:translation initiation factor IF-2 [Desulfovibrio sp. OttesenSCG-928-A18]|nr:translation initiation factor IF-2 [Desulfovibrio sp. OttesenSCG-928-A18]